MKKKFNSLFLLYTLVFFRKYRRAKLYLKNLGFLADWENSNLKRLSEYLIFFQRSKKKFSVEHQCIHCGIIMVIYTHYIFIANLKKYFIHVYIQVQIYSIRPIQGTHMIISCFNLVTFLTVNEIYCLLYLYIYTGKLILSHKLKEIL